jgi:hypothetical protein
MSRQAANCQEKALTGGHRVPSRASRMWLAARRRLLLTVIGILALVQGAAGATVVHASATPSVGDQFGSASWAQTLYPDGSIAYCTMNWSLTESPTSQSLSNPVPVRQLTLSASGNCAYSTEALGIYIDAPGWVDSSGNPCVGAQVAYNSSGWTVGPGSCYLNNPLPGSHGGTVTFSDSSDGVSASASTLVLP